MKHQNVTLSIPKDLLIRAKHIAIDRDMSLSGMLTKMLREIVEQEDMYLKVKDEHFRIMEEGSSYVIGEQNYWKRDELHDRK